MLEESCTGFLLNCQWCFCKTCCVSELLVLDLKCVSEYMKTEMLWLFVVRLVKSQHMKKFPLPKGKLSTKETITILIILGLFNTRMSTQCCLGHLEVWLFAHIASRWRCSVKTQIFLLAVWSPLFLNWIWGSWPFPFCGGQALLSHWPSKEWAHVSLEVPVALLCQHSCVIHVGSICLFTGSWLCKKCVYCVWKFCGNCKWDLVTPLLWASKINYGLGSGHHFGIEVYACFSDFLNIVEFSKHNYVDIVRSSLKIWSS